MKYKEVICSSCGERQFKQAYKRVYYDKCRKCGKQIEVASKHGSKNLEFGSDPQEVANMLGRFKEITDV